MLKHTLFLINYKTWKYLTNLNIFSVPCSLFPISIAMLPSSIKQTSLNREIHRILKPYSLKIPSSTKPNFCNSFIEAVFSNITVA